MESDRLTAASIEVIEAQPNGEMERVMMSQSVVSTRTLTVMILTSNAKKKRSDAVKRRRKKQLKQKPLRRKREEAMEITLPAQIIFPRIQKRVCLLTRKTWSL